ncbi:MAG: PHP domain-containing protein [Candidatus Krumholzibacteria bacterium]|nr:PHP domain-containing protein [Candidatus Krumholzibacteria bacterium]
MEGLGAPCDLHIHSYYSDGNLSPEELVRRARSAGLSALSITDHDTVLGQEEAVRASSKYGIEFLTGIELSIREGGLSLHILGYLFDPGNPDLLHSVQELSKARLERARSIIRKLDDEGVRIPFEVVLEEAGNGTVGRPHIANVLWKSGFVDGIQDAFNRYIGYSRPCYVPEVVLPLERVVRLIEGAGGVAVWAHPGKNIRRKVLLERLCESGVKGLEVYHPNHVLDVEKELRASAAERGLICTGGSDFHSRETMQADIGEISVSYEAVLALREAVSGCRDW